MVQRASMQLRKRSGRRPGDEAIAVQVRQHIQCWDKPEKPHCFIAITFTFVMSLLAMPLGLRFCASSNRPRAWLLLGLAIELALVGTGWATSLHLFTNGLRRQSSS